MARPLAEGLSVEVIVTDDRIRRRLVPFAPMGFDDAVRATLESAKPPRRPETNPGGSY